MKVRTKLVVVILFVASVPTAVIAFTTLRIHQQAHEAAVKGVLAGAAEFGGMLAELELAGHRRSLAGVIHQGTHWPALSREEREGALWLLFGQRQAIAAVLLLDQTGRFVAEPAALSGATDDPNWAAHPTITSEALMQLPGRLTLNRGRPGEIWTGDVLKVGEERLVPLLFGVSGVNGHAWVVAVLISTRGVCDRIEKHQPPGARFALWSETGVRACSQPAPLSTVRFEAVVEQHDPTAVFRDRNGSDWLVAKTATKEHWTLAIGLPVGQALEPARRIREQSLLWLLVGIVGAISAGALLAQGIVRPLRELERAAQQVAQGEAISMGTSTGDDEFGDLARAFDKMSAEIQAWNSELHQRVEARTRELRLAQDQLLDARKMSAMASFSAGISHEVNNPLASVLAFTQILLADARRNPSSARQLEVLATLEEEALRIRDIVRRMQELSEENPGRSPLSVNDFLDGICGRVGPRLKEAGITLESSFDPDLPTVHANADRLEVALSHVFDNAIHAMAGQPKKTMSLYARAVDDNAVVLELSDTGRGIPPDKLGRVFDPFFTDKEYWSGLGLGLSLVHRIVTDHRGTVLIDSAVGAGTTVRITLPASPREAHLV